MKHIYLALAIIGTVAPYAAFVPWVAENGIDLPLLVSEMFASRISTFFSLDVIVSAVIVLVLAVRAIQRGVQCSWLAIVGTLTVGVSCGLPLFLYLEARQGQATTEATGVEK